MLIGVIGVYLKEVRPFTDERIRAVAEFRGAGGHRDGKYAGLAETREALVAQQATAEVMQVINGSSGDLAPVSGRCSTGPWRCAAPGIGGLGTWQGDRFSFVAALGVSAGFLTEYIANNEVSPGPPAAFCKSPAAKAMCSSRTLRRRPLCRRRSADPGDHRSRRRTRDADRPAGPRRRSPRRHNHHAAWSRPFSDARSRCY